MTTQDATKGEDIRMFSRMLTAEQVAQVYQVSPKTIYRWAKQGAIPAFREGRVVRFFLRDVEKHILSRSRTGDA